MKISWIDILLIILGLILAYQLILKILGGSWQTEAIIIGLLMMNLGLTWKLALNFYKLDMRFNRHIDWHKTTSFKE
ncbi:hypothetical protein CMI42_00690 [Candidatus Pacearchaeota archaeon]|nr:hypothetical protein [Candidatus Pacearchaeota archaeon]|tara:strand:- start:2254 stop:2481 length:228 start_codon:yes stop_codon:yes gene_type:complete